MDGARNLLGRRCTCVDLVTEVQNRDKELVSGSMGSRRHVADTLLRDATRADSQKPQKGESNQAPAEPAP